MVKVGSGAQRSVETYYLNENQAAYVSILSRTRTAAEIRIQIVQEVDGEPRILDTDLGEALGMAKPENIRQTIKGNLEDLQRFGLIAVSAINKNGGRGAPGQAFYLNENQAAYVSILSRTRTAAEIRIQIVQEVKGEPRILDLDLARALGMSQIRDIRSDLIKPNIEELQRLGSLRAIPAMIKTGKGAHRSVETYYLNDEQAAYVSILSRIRLQHPNRSVKHEIPTRLRNERGCVRTECPTRIGHMNDPSGLSARSEQAQDRRREKEATLRRML